MTGWAVQLAAAVRVAEPWSWANILGAALLGALVAGVVLAALFVTLRR